MDMLRAQERILALRSQIQDLKAERTALKPNAVPLDAAIRALHRWVDWLCAGVQTSSIMQAFAVGQAPRADIFFNAHFQTEHCIAAMVAWSNPAAFKKRAETALREHYETRSFVTADESQRTAEINQLLFSTEVAEEQLIAELEREGLSMQRRNDADPNAVLAAAIDIDSEGDVRTGENDTGELDLPF